MIHVGGYQEYPWWCSVRHRKIKSTSGGYCGYIEEILTMSTYGRFSTSEGYHDPTGGIS